MSTRIEKIRERLREKLKKLDTPEKRKNISNRLDMSTIARKFHYRTAKSNAKLVILYGPPGSGKSKYLRDAKLKTSDYVHISIDNIIESIGIFCTQSRETSLKVFGTNGKLTKTELVQRLDKLPRGEVDKISTTYRKFAESKNSFSKTLKDKMVYIFENSINEGKNIILEMTGTNPLWFNILRDNMKHIKNKNYEVQFVFPVISFEQMWLQYRMRAARQILSSSECVRFGMFKSKAKQSYQQSYNNFINKWGFIKNLSTNIIFLNEKGLKTEVVKTRRTHPKNVSNKLRNSEVNKTSL
tara:strand:- start:830 stop:1723 length:894 start_codon:yes stop_codon:yes gene_type:complete